MSRNISFRDILTSYYNFVKSKNLITVVTRYRLTFRNYPFVILMHARNGYPINAKTNDGKDTLIMNPRHLHSLLTDLKYDAQEDTALVEFGPHNLKFHGGIDNGDIIGIFHEECYRFLPVENKIVVDIGANIADSAMYFACRNAKSIIAIEPYAKNYTLATRNVDSNNLSDKIILVLAACSEKSGNISLENSVSNVYMSLETQKSGIPVELLTLEDILYKYEIDSAVLKMDCEGSEYSIIMGEREDILRRFSHIQIEYHYGYENLVGRLEECGFRVSISKPTYRFNKYVKKRNMYVGWIYAERIIA